MNKNKKIILVVLCVILFLFLGYDGLHHWDEACFLGEAAYGREDGFKCFPKDEFRSHVFILTQVVKIFGTGLSGLFLTDLTYAFFILGFVFISYLILKELFGTNKAFNISIFLMFLPLTLYLSFKTLTEVFAILISVVVILLFIYGLKSKDIYLKSSFYLLSAILLVFASNARLDSPIMFFSFCFALLVAYYKKYGFKRIFISTITVGILSLLFLTIWVDLTEINPSVLYRPYSRLTKSELESRLFLPDLERFVTIEKITIFFLVGAIFTLFIPFSLLSYRTKEFKFGFSWFLAVNFPSWILLSGFEVRYLYIILIPFSILVWLGFEKLVAKVSKGYKKYFSVIIFILIIFINLLFFMPYMETEINEKDYIKTIKEIGNKFEDNIILIPIGYSDYSFLKFIYPEKNIFVVQNYVSIYDRHIKEELENLYKENYIGDFENLKRYDKTKLYICFNRSTKDTLFKKLVRPLVSKFQINNKNNLYDTVCAYSWIWNHPRLKLEKIMQYGKYEVYEVIII